MIIGIWTSTGSAITWRRISMPETGMQTSQRTTSGRWLAIVSNAVSESV